MQKIYDLIKAIILTCLAITALIGSWLFIQKQTQLRQAQTIRANNTPDAFTHKIIYQDIDQKGQLNNVLTSKNLTHYPNKNRSLLSKPKLILHGKNQKGITAKEPQQPWTITADHAETLEGSKVIKLYGHVKIDKAADDKNPEQHLRTDSLTLYPKENRMSTPDPVLLWQPDTTIQATGLHADLKKDTVVFLANTHIIHKPSASSPSKKSAENMEEKRFSTHQLTFHPKTNIAETKDPVTLEQAGTTVYATGLKANLKENTVVFLSRTKIIYKPDKAKSSPVNKIIPTFNQSSQLKTP